MPAFRVHGIQLHVELDGPSDPDAPLVVLLHGALAAGQAFRSQRVALRDEARLALVDLRGHGRSTHLGGEVGWETLTHEQLAADVLALLDLLSPDAPAHLVGASLGGIVAARVCAERPERVASLALLGTSAVAGAKRRAYFEALTPETLPLSTQRLSAMWHGEPYWRDLARHLFARIVALNASADASASSLPSVAAAQTPEVYPTRLAPSRALVMQALDDEILEPREAEIWVERIDAPTTLVRPPGDHAFFADGRSGSRAANAALRAHLLPR